MTINGRGVCTFVAETHAYAIDGEPCISVTQAVDAALGDDYSAVPEAIRAYAAERGTKAHVACDLIDQGFLDWDHLRAEAPLLVPLAEAWQRFRESEPFSPEGPRLLGVEMTYEERVWWKPLRVAGTLDRRGEWGHRRHHIVEIKTGKTLRWQHGVQLAGYVMLYLLGDGVPLGEPLRTAFGDIGRTVVQLGREKPARSCICSGCRSRAGYHVVSYDDPDDLDTFLACLHLARAKAKAA